MKFKPEVSVDGKIREPKKLRKIWSPNGGKPLPLQGEDAGLRLNSFEFRPKPRRLNVSWSKLDEKVLDTTAQDQLIKAAREEICKSAGIPKSYVFGAIESTAEKNKKKTLIESIAEASKHIYENIKRG